ncbi:hypothetical protein RCL1_004510 [Eukaryota sp. TZLM3-RCL]
MSDYEDFSSDAYSETDVENNLLDTCYSEVLDIVGEDFPYDEVISACQRAGGNVDLALDFLYSAEEHPSDMVSDELVIPQLSVPSLSPITSNSNLDTTPSLSSVGQVMSIKPPGLDSSVLKKASEVVTKSDCFPSCFNKVSVTAPTPVQSQPKKSRTETISKSLSNHNHVTVAVIGHVDSGKSSLVGQLLVQTNEVDSRTIERFKQEAELIKKGSFAYAWVTDVHADERSRGLTVDVSLRRFSTSAHTRVTILDSPGHRDFVSRAAQSLSEADVAILVFDVSHSNPMDLFVSGQAREHVLIAKSLGVRDLIVALNKIDQIDWSRDQFEQLKRDLAFNLKSCGYSNVHFIPISAHKGINITTISPEYSYIHSGLSLTEIIDSLSNPPISDLSVLIEEPLVIPIMGTTFSDALGTISLCGRVESGSLVRGDEITYFPGNQTARVSSIVSRGVLSDCAIIGDDVEIVLNLARDFPLDSIHLISSKDNPNVSKTRHFQSKLIVFEPLVPITMGRNCLLIHHNVSEEVVVAKLVSLDPPSSSSRLKLLPSRSRAVVNIRSSVELFFTPLKKTSRFLLRDGAETIACGVFVSSLDS